MEFPTPGGEQAVVGRLLRKGVLEYVGGLRRYASCVEQLGLSEGSQMRCQLWLRQSRDLPYQLLAPLTADDRANLQYALGTFGQPIDAGSENFFHRIRHGTAVALALNRH